MSDLWADAEVISAYTRAQAIEDGVLIPTTDLVPDELDFAEQAGFKVSTVLTSALAQLVIPSETEQSRGYQSVKGRLWDVLNMARMYGTRARHDAEAAGDLECTWYFPCIFLIAGRDEYRSKSGAKVTVQRTFHLRCTMAPGDEGVAGGPVVTIGFPRDF